MRYGSIAFFTEFLYRASIHTTKELAMPRSLSLATCLTLVLLPGSLARADNDSPAFKSVQSVLGREGKVDNGILRLTYARDDLGDVTIGGDKVDPGLVYESWFGFMPMGNSTMMMGDFCLTEKELPQVQRFIVENGFSVAAVHNHVVDESHRMMFMHVSAHGDAQKLAETIKGALAKTTTPTGKEEEEKPAAVDWSAAQKVLGKPDEVEGPKVEFVFPRADQIKVHGMAIPSTSGFETADEAAFQMVGNGQAVAYAEFLLKPDELDATIRTFSKAGFVVNAVHNHMTDDEPRMIFIHAWGKGDLSKLAQTVSDALKQSDTQFRKAHP
jgi:hypothetical protein